MTRRIATRKRLILASGIQKRICEATEGSRTCGLRCRSQSCFSSWANAIIVNNGNLFKTEHESVTTGFLTGGEQIVISPCDPDRP